MIIYPDSDSIEWMIWYSRNVSPTVWAEISLNPFIVAICLLLMSRTNETSLPSLLFPEVKIYGPPITSNVNLMLGVRSKFVGYS